VRALAIAVVLCACDTAPPRGVGVDAPSPVDARAVDASAPAGAGRVACGATSCPATPTPSMNLDSEDYCCGTTPTDGPAFCVHGNLGACESGNPFYCDAAADCLPGLVCCNDVVRPGLFHCAGGCADLQMCGTDDECRNGLRCTRRVCAGAEYGFCGALTTDQAARLNCP
jgi:hypothetical protein